MTVAYGAAGTGMQVAGALTENDDLREAGQVIGNGAALGGIGGGAVSSTGHGCAACKTPGGSDI
jgi:hypothetical protein